MSDEENTQLLFQKREKPRLTTSLYKKMMINR